MEKATDDCNIAIFVLCPDDRRHPIRVVQSFPDLVVDSASPYVSHSSFSPGIPVVPLP